MYKLLDFLSLLLNIRTARNTEGIRLAPLAWLRKLWQVLRVALLLFLAFFGVLVLTSFLTDTYFKQRNTSNKLDSLSRIIVHHRQTQSMLPVSLKEVIANDPQKRDLAKDSWGNQMHYLFNQQSRTFSLTSAGKDQVLHTADDMTLRVEVGSTL
ncbi:hypothetical protein [Rufibacter soli]